MVESLAARSLCSQTTRVVREADAGVDLTHADITLRCFLIILHHHHYYYYYYGDQENRKLRSMHAAFGEQVCGLMDISLLRQQPKWKEKIEARCCCCCCGEVG